MLSAGPERRVFFFMGDGFLLRAASQRDKLTLNLNGLRSVKAGTCGEVPAVRELERAIAIEGRAGNV